MKKIIYLLSLFTLVSCVCKKEKPKEELVSAQIRQPQTIIYKTKKDYSNLVPIQMNEERTKIVGFPAPSDLKCRGELRTPIKIKDSYFLDRRGISKNTVFVNIEYKHYANYRKTPTLEMLKTAIVDKNPFVEMYVCPKISEKTPLDELQEIVDNHFPNCIKIKL